MTKARDYEREVKTIALEKSMTDTQYDEIQHKYEQAQRQNNYLREEHTNLKHDVNVLINVISGARTHGRWDVSTHISLLIGHMIYIGKGQMISTIEVYF